LIALYSVVIGLLGNHRAARAMAMLASA